MLPCSGYFQNINCPFYDIGLCDRSYCHYNHVKRDATNSTKEGGSTEVGGNSLLGVGDEQNILQQLVSEAVKKALRDTSSSTSDGDSGKCNSSGSKDDVSSKLVEKVIEGLKPLVARSPPPLPTPAVSAPIPSYKPTPISELRKRHIPVPYTPKDTKTILVKRQLGGDIGSQLTKTKSVSTKRREEYVPAVSGKAIDCEKSSYKPYTLQNYGEARYSPNENRVASEILYTPSSRALLPSKTSDYVPTGLSDTILPNAFYEPTNRGDSPIQEPEYQPDVGASSSAVSYTPSKLDGLKEKTDVENKIKASGSRGGSPIPSSSLSRTQALDGKVLNENRTKRLSLPNDTVNDVEAKVFSEEVSEHVSAVKGSGSESSHNNNAHSKSKSKSKEKHKTGSSAKHSSNHNHKDSKNHRRHHENKDAKSHGDSRDHKDGKGHKDTKSHKENGEHKDAKVSKSHKPLKDVKALRDTKTSKEEGHHKDGSSHRSIKEGKDLYDKHKRKNMDNDEFKSKRQCMNFSEGSDGKRKDKTLDASQKSESKSKSETSRRRHAKDRKGSDEKHNSKHSSSAHTSSKSKIKYKSESVGTKESHSVHNSLSKKTKSSASSSSNITKHNENVPGASISEVKKTQPAYSFEEMEARIQERLQDSDFTDDLLGDSDTDEEIRTEECLKIFNSYKPEKLADGEESHKRLKLLEKQPEAGAVAPAVKKRLAHEGAALLSRKANVPRKAFDPAMAMVQRLNKAKEQMPELQLLQPKTLAGKRRIAHVPNVSKLLDAKEKILSVMQNTRAEPTICQTVAKGSQRVAHVPPRAVTCRPLISSIDGSKIPTNVRQKYCNLMFEELLKKVESVDDCCRLTLEEEESCYARSSSRNVYVNLAIITIQRLRNMAAQAKSDASCGSKLTVRHENVIGGKAKAKGLWSIIPPKKLPPVVDEGLAYQLMMEKYVLTEDEMRENGYPRLCPDEKGKAIIIETIYRSKTKSKSYFERICDRCGKEYLVNEKGCSRFEEQCVYHWGRPYKKRGIGELETRYSCCQGEARAEGCCVWNCHVSDMFDPDNQWGFVEILEKPTAATGNIFSLDCEMCYTTEGIELLRVTVINFDGETVYDALVKPEKAVLDYATRFSGITEDDMEGVTRTLLDVQATLLSMFHKKTILIGHSLDSDLKALKLIHDTVIDTSMVFPHRRGPPFKRALKTLCAEYLQKIIQSGEEGHDSAEDALACIELMKWRLKEDLKAK